MARKNAELQKNKVSASPIQPIQSSVTSFPIIGIGASAGGLAAFEAFFSGMPADTEPDMAFVLVRHLAPDHKSILAELVQRFTRLHVFEVEDGAVVHPNCVYIIPPNCDITILKGSLHLVEPSTPRGQRLPIDSFFRSLAQDQGELSIGIVLSGTGSDGTLGVQAIKGEGGMVMVQTPESAEYDGMPQSAIATGLVDYTLPPREMADQLIAYAIYLFDKSPKEKTALALDSENALKKIFILLKAQTGHDFSQYKLGTLHRRIERRMALHQIKTIAGYVKYLQKTPDEVAALFNDLLIGVTNFFRDPEAFKALEDQVIPKIFAGKRADSVIRVWVPGCSTGEEAYSIAILLAERQEAMKQSFKVQVFATDIDKRAIATARSGIYPASIATDISPERLRRFFVPVPDRNAYRIHKGIRDMLVFSEHNLIKDPPFSKLDLISCRNLLIYLDSDLQKKIIPLFHYALNPEGYLFQGTSETVAEFIQLFATVDRSLKLYQRKECAYGVQPARSSRFLPSMPAVSVGVSHHSTHATPFPAELPLQELTEKALLQRTPAAVLVNNQGDTLYFHGRTGMYLEPALGKAGVSNIVKMAREGLQSALTTALHKAVLGQETIHHLGLRVKTNGDFSAVNLTVQPIPTGPVTSADAPLYLIILEAAPVPPTVVVKGTEMSEATDSNLQVENAQLRAELLAKEEYVQALREQLETSSEELKSSNEEMQSVNEELQSTNEELETSKEELQSVNEEITSVNNELQTNMASLSQANDDMDNMLGGTGIGTVFVDHKLRILRYTPTATRMINLIPSDVGRPVGHTVTNLVGYDSLVADLQAVLNTLIPKNVEVQTADGGWFSLRIQPYRTRENVIEGAVVTFMDISEIIQAREALRKANELNRLAVVVRDAYDAITVQDLEGRIIAWNQGAIRMYGWSEAEALMMHAADRIPKEHRADALAKIYQLSMAKVLEPYHTQRLAKDGAIVEVWLTSTALVNETGKMYAISTTERAEEVDQRSAAQSPEDIDSLSAEEIRLRFHELRVHQIELEMQNVQLRQTQEALAASQTRYFDLYDMAPVGYCTISKQGLLMETNLKASDLLGMARSELVGQRFSRFIHTEDNDAYYLFRMHLFESSASQECELRMVRLDGTTFWAHLLVTLEQDESGVPVIWMILSDITGRKQVEMALKESETRFDQLAQQSGTIVWEVDAQGLYTYVSHVVEDVWGYRPEDLVGERHFYDLHPVDGREAFKTAAFAVFTQKKLFKDFENAVQAKDGSIKWVLTNCLPLLDSKGNLLGYRGSDTDITKRKQVETVLHRKQAMLGRTEKIAQVGSWEWDVATDTMTWSDELFRIFQLETTERAPSFAEQTELFHPEDMERLKLAIEAAVSNGTPYEFELRALRKDGKTRGFLCLARGYAEVIQGGGVTRLVGSLQDITERNRTEEENKSLQAQLLQAQKMEAIGTLAGGIAHDFNNILGAILGYTEILSDHIPPESIATEYLDKVMMASQRAAGLVKQILAFSRQANIKRVPLNPSHIVEEAIKFLRPSLPSTITINQSIDTASRLILADPTQVHQILMNLCTNAFHAMEHTGGILEISLEVQELSQENLQYQPEVHPGKFVLFSVGDTGLGIDPEILDKIFNPYFTTKEVGKGTGMGLAISHGIVASYGGFITCESEIGRGTVFRVYFPAIEEVIISKVKPVDVVATSGKERILLIDDEKMLADLGKTMLERLGYEVTALTSSLEALAIFQNQPDLFDAIITDQTMPGMTGIELSRKILEIRPKIPIILCTGYCTLTFEEQAKIIGIKEFVEKPMTKIVIAKLLRGVLDESRMESFK